jgi:competence protein ComEC
MMAGILMSLALPDPRWGLMVAVLLPALWRLRQVAMAWALLGLIVGAVNGVLWLDTRLPGACLGQTLIIKGRIDTLPTTEPAVWGGWRVQAELVVQGLSDDQCKGPKRIRVSQHLDATQWDQSLRYGATVSGPMRLRSVSSQLNPGTLPDQARWAARTVDAAATVMGPLDQVAQSHWLERFRLRLLDEWSQREGEGWAVLRALLLGDSRGISQPLWSELKQLGIVHLIVISGLHIALLAGFVAQIAQLPRRLWRVPRDRGTDTLATASVLAVSGLYVLLIGAPLPAQRALLMLLAAKVPHLLGWPSENRRSLLLAMAVMLLWEPHIALGPSFWLSAVATWILVADTSNGRSVSGLLLMQLKLVFLMAPLTLFWFGEASWLGILTNIVMVPAVTMIMVPAGFAGALLSGFLPSVSTVFLELSVWLWEFLMPFATVLLGACDFCTMVRQPLPLAGFILGLASAFCWMSHRRSAVAAYLVTIALALVIPRTDTETVVTLLDVGQGLAIVIETHGKTMLYDTGDGYPGGFTQAEKILLPYLRSRGIDVIDVLLVSHADRDHSGGVSFLSERMPIKRHLGFAGEPCRNGERWRWATVEIMLVNGSGQGALNTNDQSCGFMLSVNGHQLLVLGDMSAAREREVVRYWRAALSSHVLVLAHHGSASSSSYALLKWVAPQWALISAGRGNRFGHPHAVVLERLRQMPGVNALNTALTGAIQIHFNADHQLSLTRQRGERTPYWLKLP